VIANNACHFHLHPLGDCASTFMVRSGYDGGQLMNMARKTVSFLLILAPMLCSAAPEAEPEPKKSALLPRSIAEGMSVMGSSHRQSSALLGWVVGSDGVVLIGAANPDLVRKAIVHVKKTTGSAVTHVVLTHARPGDLEASSYLVEQGIPITAAPETVAAIREKLDVGNGGANNSAVLHAVAKREKVHLGGRDAELIPFGHAAGRGNLAVYFPNEEILFTGELCVNGPRSELKGSNGERWLLALRELDRLPAKLVVPGFGKTGGRDVLVRQRDFLLELRQQVGWNITMAKPLEYIQKHVSIPTRLTSWWPYDKPNAEDVAHVHRELTVPFAPFGARPFDESDRRPRALCLIGDHVHDPRHIEAGLQKAFDAAGVNARFAVDPRALSAENLKQVQLFAILRDGTIYPKSNKQKYDTWMTPEQERALIEFTESGGAFLPLHNSHGLYDGRDEYIKLIGGIYDGHGPLERFRVVVEARDDPVARGVVDYEVGDEQHTPIRKRDDLQVFLRSYSEEGVAALSGWKYERGKGRVCYLANGHTPESLQHFMVQRLLRNAIRWSLKIEEER
jgi:type 1 glutamine amidotransferase